jgi:hypothetical protein
MSLLQERLTPSVYGVWPGRPRTASALSHGTSGAGSPADTPSGPVSPHVTYSDLCFPKTSNYGSMRKEGRIDVAARLSTRL